MAKEGVLGGLAHAEVFGIPVGAAATGALLAGAWDGVAGLVGGMIPQASQWPWLIPAIGSVVTVRFMPRLVGTHAANVGGLLLAYDAIQGLFNIRSMVSGLFSKFTTPTSSAAAGPVVHRQPETIEEYLKSRGA